MHVQTGKKLSRQEMPDKNHSKHLMMPSNLNLQKVQSMDPSVVTAKNPSIDSTKYARDYMVQLMWERFWASQVLSAFAMYIFSEAPELLPAAGIMSSVKCLNDTGRALLVKQQAAIASASAAQFSVFPAWPPRVLVQLVFLSSKWKTTGKSSELGSCTLSWPSHLRLSETIGEVFG